MSDQKRVDALIDELKSPDGARIKGRFVSVKRLKSILADQSFRLEHLADGIWIATEMTEAERSA